MGVVQWVYRRCIRVGIATLHWTRTWQRHGLPCQGEESIWDSLQFHQQVPSIIPPGNCFLSISVSACACKLPYIGIVVLYCELLLARRMYHIHMSIHLSVSAEYTYDKTSWPTCELLMLLIYVNDIRHTVMSLYQSRVYCSRHLADKQLFHNILYNPDYVLYHLLPSVSTSSQNYLLRQWATPWSFIKPHANIANVVLRRILTLCTFLLLTAFCQFWINDFSILFYAVYMYEQYCLQGYMYDTDSSWFYYPVHPAQLTTNYYCSSQFTMFASWQQECFVVSVFSCQFISCPPSRTRVVTLY